MAVAFALYPTSMDDRIAVSDAGAIMPAQIHMVRAQARRRHDQPRIGPAHLRVAERLRCKPTATVNFGEPSPGAIDTSKQTVLIWLVPQPTASTRADRTRARAKKTH
jgi:hypothetical protein